MWHRVSLDLFLYEVCIVRGVSGNVVLKATDVSSICVHVCLGVDIVPCSCRRLVRYLAPVVCQLSLPVVRPDE